MAEHVINKTLECVRDRRFLNELHMKNQKFEYNLKELGKPVFYAENV